jgi:Plasmid pRiA4b ORF-3-like protein
MASPFDTNAFVIAADVHILDIEPKISRSLELPVALNFAQLHEVLQAAFGWTDSHLHQFNVGGLIVGASEFDQDGLSGHQTFEATEVRLQDLVFPYDEDDSLTILYEYDFGDDWRHRIVMRRIPAQAGVKYPRCVAGSRSRPPEDVGGPSGYLGFLEAWLDPTHDEHKAMRRWAGRKFDPECFDLEATDKAISKAVRVARGGYRFRHERP